ncbi:MAG TPA: prephenate dehydrogenase/arogenate dehydrogenase family protein [Ktedonobacterales bacterium]|jgi:prephenate dehydrogenase
MQTVAIIGLGLIGGSLGLALKHHNESSGEHRYQVIGYDQRQEQREQARQRGAIDQASPSLAEAVQQADVIMLATPALAIRQVLSDLAPLLREGALLSDVASTKAQVMRWAAELVPPHARFIGGHPMAGSTGSLEAATSDLFTGATYCLVLPDGPARSVPDMLSQMIADVGANLLLLDAATHDQAVAAISHLPFLAASALVETVAAADEKVLQVMSALASSGFRDTTRLATGDPTMYHDISLTNREAILSWLEAYLAQLQALRDLLQTSPQEQDARLKAVFNAARQHRDFLLSAKTHKKTLDRSEKDTV